MSYVSIPIPTSFAAGQFAQILAGLRHTVAKYIARDRNAGPTIILICNYLSRLAARFAALAARAQAGTLRVTGRRLARGTTRGTTRSVASLRAPRLLPSGFAWLGNLTWEARASGTQLQHLVLNDPEIAALIVACPQAGRILRTLFWITSVRPIPAILRVSRPRVALAAPLPSREGLSRREVKRSRTPAGRSPPSEPVKRATKRELRSWARPRGKLRSTTGPPSGLR